MGETRTHATRTGGRMTLEEWDALDEDVEGELVDGILVEEEVPNFVHEIIVTWLAQTLGTWVNARGGVAGASGVKYGLALGLGRKPDFSVFFSGPLPPAEGLVRIPPDIAVEIVSRAARDRRRDRIEKYAEYARFGIAAYWIIDPKPRTVEIFVLGDDARYAGAFVQSTGTHDAIPGCPGLRLDLDDLWRQVDRVERRS
jgi:Uma2 family endonuclease